MLVLIGKSTLVEAEQIRICTANHLGANLWNIKITFIDGSWITLGDSQKPEQIIEQIRIILVTVNAAKKEQAQWYNTQK